MTLGWKSLTALLVLSSGAMGVFSVQAVADVTAVMQCRQLPPGPVRADCLERATADMERQDIEGGRRTSNAAPASQGHVGKEMEQGASQSHITAAVESITYQNGRPVFRLANGQTWYSMDRRRLTFKRGHSHAVIEKTPVGMLLHYNGSFFALQVVPRTG